MFVCVRAHVLYQNPLHYNSLRSSVQQMICDHLREQERELQIKIEISMFWVQDKNNRKYWLTRWSGQIKKDTGLSILTK